MNNYRILIVDDEAPQRDTLGGYIENQGYDVLLAGDSNRALELVREETVDVVLTDFRMPGMSGLELLAEIQKINPEIAVIVMTAYGSIDTAVQAMKQGAYTYVSKPLDLESLRLQLERALEHKLLLAENRELRARYGETGQSDLIAVSEEMREVLGLAARAAPSKASVLILGESGTGKELIARAIHSGSPRKDEPFIAVNISAIPETLLESELFGHEKGSFTGASSAHRGHFERADSGTLFIDEIGDMPLSSQVKLLRVLQENTITRVGGESPLEIDVRVIAATHRDLQKAMTEGDFREDLFYRLNVVRISVPPLRARKSDIPPLIEHFIAHYSRLNGKNVSGMDRDSLDHLMKHSWPGNVRELENAIESAVVLTRSDIITLRDLPSPLRSDMPVDHDRLFPDDDSSHPLPQRIESYERYMIERTLEETGGNRSETARRLGMSEKNIRDRLKRWRTGDD